MCLQHLEIYIDKGILDFLTTKCLHEFFCMMIDKYISILDTCDASKGVNVTYSKLQEIP